MEGISALSFGKIFNYGFAILFVVYFIFNIFSGAVIGVTTGDWKPLLDNTIGQMVAADKDMYETVQVLKDPQQTSSLSYEYLNFLRTKLAIDLAIMVIMIYFIYKALSYGSSFIGAGSMVSSWNIVFAIIIYGVIGLIYNLIMMMITKTFVFDWTLIPYYGVFHLIINAAAVFNFSSTATKEALYRVTSKI